MIILTSTFWSRIRETFNINFWEGWCASPARLAIRQGRGRRKISVCIGFFLEKKATLRTVTLVPTFY